MTRASPLVPRRWHLYARAEILPRWNHQPHRRAALVDLAERVICHDGTGRALHPVPVGLGNAEDVARLEAGSVSSPLAVVYVTFAHCFPCGY